MCLLYQFYNDRLNHRPLLVSLLLEVSTHHDDEYAWAGVEDPKVVVTTSHDPSSKLKQFAKVEAINTMSMIHIVTYIHVHTTQYTMRYSGTPYKGHL